MCCTLLSRNNPRLRLVAADTVEHKAAGTKIEGYVIVEEAIGRERHGNAVTAGGEMNVTDVTGWGDSGRIACSLVTQQFVSER